MGLSTVAVAGSCGSADHEHDVKKKSDKGSWLHSAKKLIVKKQAYTSYLKRHLTGYYSLAEIP